MGTKSHITYATYKGRSCYQSPVNSPVTFEQITPMVATVTGTQNPYWRSQVSEGVSATTALTASRETILHYPGRWTGTDGTSFTSYSDKQGINAMTYNDLNPTSNIVEVARSNATSKAYRILSRLTSPFSGQVFLGELKETKDLLIHPLRQSVELTKSLVKNRKIGKNVAKSWLEFQFGFSPLLSDVDSIIDIVNGKLQKVEKLSYRVYDKQDESASSAIVGAFDVYGFKQRVETTDSWLAECVIRFGVTQKYLDSANKYRSDWSASFMDLAAVPMTTWELIPWSFLIDYFVNVSDIIQAFCTSTRGVAYVSKSQIMTRGRKQVGSTVATAGTQYKITENVPRVVTSTKRSVVRDGSPLGIPSVVFSLPGSSVRYLNIAALIASFKSPF